MRASADESPVAEAVRRTRHLNWCRVQHDLGKLDADQLASEEQEFAEWAARLERAREKRS